MLILIKLMNLIILINDVIHIILILLSSFYLALLEDSYRNSLLISCRTGTESKQPHRGTKTARKQMVPERAGRHQHHTAVPILPRKYSLKIPFY